MPKEATHWILADQSWQAMPDGLLKREIRENKALYYLGAIAFDMPYYVVVGQNRSNLHAAAQRLHGYNATRSFNPFGPLARSPETMPEGYRPFLAGALTHVAADAVFHPFIYYFGGNDEDSSPNRAAQATARHRRIETALDLHFISRNGNLAFRNLKLFNLYQHRENEDRAFRKLLNLLYFGKVLLKDSSLKLALWQHALIHVLIHQKRLYQFVELIDILCPRQARRVKPIEALFYASCQETDPRLLQRPFGYRHPVTGEERQESAEDLQDRTVALALEFLEKIDNIDRQSDLKKRLADAAFPSLYHGLPPHPDLKMRFFETSRALDF